MKIKFKEETARLWEKEMTRLKEQNEMFRDQKIDILKDRDHYAHKLNQVEYELELVKEDLDRLRKRVSQTKEVE